MLRLPSICVWGHGKICQEKRRKQKEEEERERRRREEEEERIRREEQERVEREERERRRKEEEHRTWIGRFQKQLTVADWTANYFHGWEDLIGIHG